MARLSDAELVILTVLYVAAFLVALVGNSFLIYIVWKVRKAGSLTSFMFVNMAVADLVVAFLVMPLVVYTIHADFTWVMTAVLGYITCGAFGYLLHIALMASILSLTLVAVDRFYTFVFPLKSVNLWFRNAKYVSPLIWIMSAVLMSIVLVFFRFDEQGRTCGMYPVGGPDRSVTNIRAFYVYIFLVSYLVPLVVMIVLYGKTAHTIWFHRTPGNGLTERQLEQQEITKRRVVRMLIIIVVVFAVCWLPVEVCNLIRGVTVFQKEIPPMVDFLSSWLAHANSAINPWLYILLMGNMRRAFLEMVGKKPKGDHHDGKTVRLTTQRTKTTNVSSESIPLARL